MKTSMRPTARVILDELEGKTPAEVKAFMAEAVAYLAERGLLGRWRDLEQEIHEAWRQKYGVSRIALASAHPLTAVATTALEKLANGADLQITVNDRLMGGAVVRVDDRRLDGTVLGALTRLKQTLLS